MSILFCSPNEAPEPWRAALAEAFPALAFQVCSRAAKLDEVRYFLTWNPPPGLWAGMPKLRAVLWLGAGVDRLLSDPSLPPDLPIVRLVDAGFAQQMSEYALYGVLYYQRRMGEYAAMQKECKWHPLSEPIARDWPVGVLGLGAIGAAVAKRIAQMGFPVLGWSARGTPVDGVEVYSGEPGAREVLARAQVLVNILPLTAQTANFFDTGVFSRMRHGAYLVNIARGGHIVEADLLAALDAGRLSGAMLDVFRDEPLPNSHPFWRHPKIILTPHVAAQTNVLLARNQIIENIARLERGEMPHGLVERSRGY